MAANRASGAVIGCTALAIAITGCAASAGAADTGAPSRPATAAAALNCDLGLMADAPVYDGASAPAAVEALRVASENRGGGSYTASFFEPGDRGNSPGQIWLLFRGDQGQATVFVYERDGRFHAALDQLCSAPGVTKP